MSPASSRPRLDEILLSQRWITEAHVSEALLRQQARGGKFGSHLLYLRYVDEQQLTNVLATQLGCDGVALSLVQIPAEVLSLVPAKLALTRRIVPFEFNADEKVLKVACEDPHASGLLNEISFAVRQAKVRLYVAPELSITAALDRCYRGRPVALEDLLQLYLPNVAGPVVATGEDKGPVTAPPAVLMVTREAFSAPLFKSLLEREGLRVFVVEDFEAALQVAKAEPLRQVFVHTQVEGDAHAFEQQLRRKSPGAALRFYDSPAALVLQEERVEEVGKLGVKGLELFTSLLAREGSHLQVRMGRYTEALCARLGLSSHDRLVCTHAAYLHDLASIHYAAGTRLDRRAVSGLSRRLLSSVNYPQPVLDMLEAMYAESTSSDRLSLAELGGSILTLVDLYCQNVGPQERLSLERLDVVKKKLRELSGRLIPSEIVEAFISLLQGESLDLQVSRRMGQVMLYASDAQQRASLELRLKNEGFRLVSESQEEPLAELYKRARPDVLLLLPGGDADAAVKCLDRLLALGMDPKETPTLLVTDRNLLPALTPLLDRGLEDLLALDTSADYLATKVGRLLDRAGGRTPDAQSGTRGRLADMNLIDLLQALGPSRRTVRITVSPAGEEPELLTVFLLAGDIRFAQCNALVGPPAVYHGITWSDGTWLVESVDEASIPPRNNQLPNESVLMEGCRLLDEQLRAGHFGAAATR